MKKIIISSLLLAGLLCGSAYSSFANVNQKVLNAFHSIFNRASDVRWTEYKDHYFVSFRMSDEIVEVNFDHSGNVLNSTRYYKAQHLPLNILLNVRNEYPEKIIHSVTEISDEDGMVYLIQLKDAKEYIYLKSDISGNLEISDRFNNAG
jgi:hypothetical protein